MSGTSQPQTPTDPRTPAARIPAAALAGCATVPASITVVTPLRRLSSEPTVAASSSCSAVCTACSGTDHEKIERPGGIRSGMQLRSSGSPVRCWWVFTSPGVITAPVASWTGTPGHRRRSSAAAPDLQHAVPRDRDGAVDVDLAAGRSW